MTLALKNPKGYFDVVTELSTLAHEELHWWATNEPNPLM